MTAATALFIFLLVAVVTTSTNSRNTNNNNHVEAFRSVVQRFLKPPAQSSKSPLNLKKSKKSLLSQAPQVSLDNSMHWWDDLAPPFSFNSVNANGELMNDSERDTDNNLMNDSDLNNLDANADSSQNYITHFLFLVHGHRGLSKDLSYVQTVMRRVAASEKRKRWLQHQQSQQSSSSGGKGEEKEEAAEFLRHDMVVHSVCCNEGKTTDGVVKGGERLVDEIMDVIRQEMKTRQPKNDQKSSDDGSSDTYDDDDVVLRNVTISILGNSLGGIYGRYAIAKLAEQCECQHETTNDENGSDNSYYILDNKFRLLLNIFCTTATPHLGVAGHTFLPLSRTAEIGVAHAMGDTGKDLFRLNNLLHTMATSPEFLEPLGSFRKRIAYANAFGTDFPVPAHTAALLNEESTYPHHFLDVTTVTTTDTTTGTTETSDDDRLVVDDNGLVIAILHTPVKNKNESKEEQQDGTATINGTTNSTCELVQMSTSLDALGWKKVFIDVRKEMPNISLPKSLRRLNININGITSSSSNNNNSNSGDGEMDDSSERLRQIDLLRQRGVVGSRDVAAAVTSPIFDDKLHWPVGHNMMVAFSRSRWSTYMNKGGRPVVDSLAKELVQDIFTWSSNNSNTTRTTTPPLGFNDQ
jgi:hypothetical protein